MASPIKIRADADFAELLKAAKNAGKSLDDLIDDFQDVEDASDDAFTSAAKDADKAGRKIGADMDDGFDKAKRGAQDFKEEAGSTAREAAASFDGSAESIGDSFQEIAANALAGFGPLGAAAGVAIAAGIGTGMAALEKFQEAMENARESAFGFASELEQTSQQVDYTASLNSWTQDLDRFKQAQDIAKGSGETLADVLDTLASGTPEGLKDLREAFDKNVGVTDLTVGRVAELGGVLDGTAEGFKNGTAAAEANAKATYRYAVEAGKATGKVDKLGNEIVKLPDGKEIVVDAETQQAYEDIDAFEKKDIKDKQAKVKVNVDSTAWDRWNPQKVGSVYSRYAGDIAKYGRPVY